MSHPFDLLGCPSISGIFDLLWGHTMPSNDELPANVFCDCSSSIEAEKQASLELGLSAFNFNVCWSCQHVGPLLEHEVSHIVEIHEVL